jgi:hypothetical protein
MAFSPMVRRGEHQRAELAQPREHRGVAADRDAIAERAKLGDAKERVASARSVEQRDEADGQDLRREAVDLRVEVAFDLVRVPSYDVLEQPISADRAELPGDHLDEVSIALRAPRVRLAHEPLALVKDVLGDLLEAPARGRSAACEHPTHRFVRDLSSRNHWSTPSLRRRVCTAERGCGHAMRLQIDRRSSA